MKIAAIQHDVIWESPSANHERLTPMVAQAASGGAELVVLSEMYSTGSVSYTHLTLPTTPYV